MTKPVSYAAIIFDLDGTVMPSGRDSKPSATICQAVSEARDKIILCAATGRAWLHTKPILEALKVNRPSIVNGGALIVDPVSETILWQETIAANTAQAILQIAKKYPYKISYATGLEVTPELDPLTAPQPDAVNTFYILDIPPGHKDLERLSSELSQYGDIAVSKALAWGVYGGTDLHITSKTATKEHAVIELCKILGVERTDVAGVGDGHNDIHLFNAVGHKIAMGNAVIELKEAADLVIDSVDNDGLAKFIKAVA